MKPRERRTVDERREQLLRAGLRLFGERPYDEVSIDEVAANVGISKGLLYHYFPTKKRFYVEVIREAAREMIARTAPARGGSVDELRSSLDAYLDYIVEHARPYRAVLRSAGHDPELQRIIHHVRQTMMRRTLDGLGLKEPPPILRAALIGWLGFVEAASLDWIDQRDVGRLRLRELLVETLVYALSFAARPA
jgi:AcrR family transcriptional regulator